ncbi:NUDIX domain-containing protein [Aureibaculum algae]|uniref:NUDIX domain-containing protein n=1 Tax=Aureibaculum algae TaxID=2584122 RepID=A0A5B7TMF8_9FLAO|nr:NUDIX domain-containing protein [Aureibaculum algae]QCX37999.1 NUDIX domain-containing protein [Aureibaculum algae]
MKTVFFNNFPINLVTDVKYQSESHFFHSNDIDVLSIIDKMEQGSMEAVFLYNDDFNSLWQHFTSAFKIIEAGGGKVFNDKNEVLFIFRNDKWDLPKGKIEKGETIEETAIREVEEETGIEKLKISHQLQTTYHIYKHKKKYVLKVSYWFKMTSDFKGELFPQLEEGITKVVWLSDTETEKALQNTYKNIKLLF